MKIYFNCSKPTEIVIPNKTHIHAMKDSRSHVEYVGSLKALITCLVPKENYRSFISSYSRIVISQLKFLYLRLYFWEEIEDKIVVVEKNNEVILGIQEDYYDRLLSIVDRIYEIIPSGNIKMRKWEGSLMRIENTFWGTEEALSGIFEHGARGTVVAEYRKATGEFVCGRKCGKLRKIAKMCGGDLGIVNRDRKDIVITMANGEIAPCVRGLEMEYPVKRRFYLDERYHKKIIGAKGINIQTIMKKYNVYVRFHSRCADDGNVELIAPFKNSHYFESVRREILEQSESYQAIFPGLSSLFSLSKSKNFPAGK